MKTQRTRSGMAAVATAGFCFAAATAAVVAQDIAAPPGGDEAGREGIEALTRGPIHEAFANPYVTNPEPGVVVAEQPPQAIDEIPPEQMPEGDNVVWIPGYWGWDPDGDAFLWISGLWRDVPAGRRWVPGYWAEAGDGWQWVAGFWASEESAQLAYLPQPPETLETGPNVAPPEGDYFWIPGCWVWQNVTYEWRPGYWAPAVADWVWVPDQYVWTPYGCVFVAGYWDHAFVDRGVIFAPVRFDQVAYQQPNYQYQPTVVIDTAPLLMHLFVAPNYSHYFYGDYYAFQPSRPRFDFVPWVDYDRRPRNYDPLLTYYQWSYGRQDVDIVQRLTVWNQYFVRNESSRPPRTFRQQRQFLARADRADLPVQASAVAFASPLREFAESRRDRVRFSNVDQPARERITERSRAVRRFQSQRSEFEVAAASREPAAGGEGAPAGEARGEAKRPTQTFSLPESADGNPAARPGAASDGDTPDADRRGGDAATEGGPEADGSSRRDRPARSRPPALPTPDRTAGPRDESQARDADGRGDRRGDGAPAARPGDDDPAGRDRPGRPRPDEESTTDAPDAEAPMTENPMNGVPRVDDPSGESRRPRGEDVPDPGSEVLPPAGDPGGEEPRQGDRPGADQTPANSGRNARGRTGAGGNAPGAGAAESDGGARFPRFGTSRNRGARPESGAGGDAGGGRGAGAGGPGGAEPGAGSGPADGPGRGAVRGGFDPFGGLPPGVDPRNPQAPGAEGRPGRQGERPNRGVVPPGSDRSGRGANGQPNGGESREVRRPDFSGGLPSLGGAGRPERRGTEPPAAERPRSERRGGRPESPAAAPNGRGSATPGAARRGSGDAAGGNSPERRPRNREEGRPDRQQGDPKGEQRG